MQRLRILVILILLSLMPLYSLAVLNEGQYAFRSLDINNGLSQNTVHAILQDKQGFMWFGTKDGLDRYDGISFRTFMKESGTLGNNFITSLYEDNLGQIWIGTDVGLYVYCPQMEKVRHFTLISNPNIDIDCTVNLITGDQKGGIWVVTQTRGIFYYNPQDSQLVNYQSDGSGTLNLKTSGQLYFDSDDVCWLDIRDGNLYYSKDKLKTLTPIFPEDSKVSFRDEYIYKLLPGPYNCMYVGTVFGLKEVNLTNKTIRTLLSKDELGGDIYIRELAFYSDDELWIGTESGLYIYNLHTAKIIHLQNVNGDPYSISDNAIYSILKDREGGMWIGTYFGGVNYYPRQYTYFDKVYPQKESNKMGKRVREFCAAHDGTLWIGTEDKGLFHYYPSTGKIEPFIHPDIYHNVHGLYLDGDYLWVGNFAKGLKRIDLRTYAVKHYDNIASDIFSICRITAGDLYLGTTIGLFRYNPDTERFKRVPELGWTFVYYIKEDKQGNLWLATYADGVYKKNVHTGGWEHFVHEEADSSTLPSNKVLSIFEDSQNQLWFTTQGGGFCRFVPSANTFVRYDGIGLPSNVIYRIEEDEKGLFWVSTNKGLVHFNPKNSSFKVYTVANGLLSNQFNYQSSYKDKNGRIYFGCINGFISFAPSSFIDNDFLPSVLITDFMLFNKKVVVGEKGSPLKQSITLSNHIELQSNQNSFSFRIAAISYQSPSMNTLLYRLEGYDSEWHTAGKGPITYSNLPYGTYMLRVKGANSDGVWNPDVRTLGIRILMVDGDDTYPAEFAAEMCSKVLEKGTDMVVGDRLSSTYFTENKRPFHNFGNSIVRGSINRLFKSNIKDIMTGYRAMSYRFVKTFPVLSRNFEIETEMTIHAIDKNMQVENVVIEYRDRPEGSESKLNTYADGFKVLKTIVKMFKNYKPLEFFSLIAAVLFVVGMAFFIPVLVHFLEVGTVEKIPTLIVSGFVILTAIICWFSGIILSTLVNQHKQDFEYQTQMVTNRYKDLFPEKK